MEDHESSALATMVAEQPEVDTARPFRSVKEAIAVLGEHLLAGDACSQKTDSSVKHHAAILKPICSLPSPKPIHSASSSPPSCTSTASQFNQEREDKLILLSSLMKKLEAELEETKRELMLLKERKSKTDETVADLKVQLHKVMSKLAEMEATKAAESSLDIEGQCAEVESNPWADEEISDMEATFEYWPTLAQALGLEYTEDDFRGRGKRKVPKKKPIIPLIGDMFSRKKGPSDKNNSFYSLSY